MTLKEYFKQRLMNALMEQGVPASAPIPDIPENERREREKNLTPLERFERDNRGGRYWNEPGIGPYPDKFFGKDGRTQPKPDTTPATREGPYKAGEDAGNGYVYTGTMDIDSGSAMPRVHTVKKPEPTDPTIQPSFLRDRLPSVFFKDRGFINPRPEISTISRYPRK